MGKQLNIRIIILLSLFAAVFLTAGCRNDVTLKSLLAAMADRDQLTRFPDPAYCLKQFSSYNPKSVSPGIGGWFANRDMSHFLRIENGNGRREFVLFDTDGPGVIVRWWMTFYKAQNGIIRVYIDHQKSPVIQGTPAGILSGTMLAPPPFAVSVQKGAPLGEEGRDYDHNFYLPIPFSAHCKITYECDSLRILYDYEGTPEPEGYYWPDVFYNINYRIYTPGTRVESFSPDILRWTRDDLERAAIALLNSQPIPSQEDHFDRILAPGDSLVLDYRRRDYAISRITVAIEPGNLPQAYRSTVLKASFDGIQTIWAPAGEFFGTGYSGKPFRTWMNTGSENGSLESCWLMPFREHGRLTWINYGSDTVRLLGSVGMDPYRWSGNSMYFGTTWHEYYRIPTRDPKGEPCDLNFADINGQGVYVGDQVDLFNNTFEWWGEGDEKISVDGEPFPSSFGTGSEDYYGYSFGRPEPFSHPFVAQPVGTGNTDWGITVNMRHRSLDAIPFHQSISANIELWHWASVEINYALTSRFYVRPPSGININPDPESVRHPVALKKGDL